MIDDARIAGGKKARPLLRWHGGKWKIAPWILGNLPPHRVYVEPFGGAASVLLRKSRSYAEVWNDLDGDLVALFRVLRGPRASDLVAALEMTPFARAEFVESYDDTDDDVERARRLIIRSFMGYGSNGGVGHTTGFRIDTRLQGTTPAHDWANYPAHLPRIIDRLRGVGIEQRPAMMVMAAHDSVETLHYVDPPYLPETRTQLATGEAKHRYRHEMSADDHAKLLEFLCGLSGMVALSGYDNRLYTSRLKGWSKKVHATHADGGRDRVEVLWLNPAAHEASEAAALPLLKGVG